tara:strand:- start:14981 stop:16615 length:1635 start_codon:yes stop_codon:yes gene_type:complete
MTEKEWIKYFPYDKPRSQQVDAINFILNSFINEDKKFVICDLPTGVGKSAVGLTVTKYLNNLSQVYEDFQSGAYVLTTQKILQEQYMNDFGAPKGALRNIKSSNNYTCNYYCKQSCAESMRMLKLESKKSRFYKTCSSMGCVYRQAKKAFLDGEEGLTNYSYFLAETVYAGNIKPRNLLILDECHNICAEMQNFVEVSFSERFANTLGIHMPEINTSRQAIIWIKDQYKPSLVLLLAKFSKMIAKYADLNIKPKQAEIDKITKRFEKLDKHLCKVNRFLDDYTKENWVLNIIPAQDKSLRKLEFTPIDVSLYSDNLLFRFGKKVLMMSATILDRNAFCQSLGIPSDQVSFISVGSPFPLKNRPVFYVPVGKMSKTSIDVTLPDIVKTIKMLLEHHKNDKGIIHATTYRIANYIHRNVKSNRLLIHDSENRQQILKEHLSSKKPTVIISPSMTEGIDLYDNLSRFQIVCKTPYPYLGSPVIRKRMNKWSWWYPYMTTKTIIQAIGRSVRSINDYCSTYILDENFEYFYSKNKNMFPNWFNDVFEK